MHRIVIFRILFSCANYSYGETFYGYAGSRNDGIYAFDFDGLKVTAYIQNRAIGTTWSYSIKSWTMKRKAPNKYVLWQDTNDPAILEVADNSSIIHGKSINHGYTFYYE